jgi:hypothetical protein
MEPTPDFVFFLTNKLLKSVTSSLKFITFWRKHIFSLTSANFSPHLPKIGRLFALTYPSLKYSLMQLFVHLFKPNPAQSYDASNAVEKRMGTERLWTNSLMLRKCISGENIEF